MSADLFAEFNSPPLPQQQLQSSAAGSQSQTPNAAFQDPFGLIQSNNTPTSPAQQSPQPWGGFQSQQQTSTVAPWGQQPANSAPPQAADDDDDFGDFEVAEPASTQPATAPEPDPWEALANRPVASPPPEDPGRTRLVRASTLDIVTNSLFDMNSLENTGSKLSGVPESPLPPQEAQRPKLKQPADPSVLFDAQEFELEGGEGEDDDDFDDDDDFGDFETVAPAPSKSAHAAAPAPAPAPARQQAAPPLTMDLLSLDDPPAPEQAPSRPKHAHKTSGPLSFGATTIAKSQGTSRVSKASTASNKSKASKATATVAADDGEWAAWDDFESAAAPGKKEAAKPAPSQGTDSWDWAAVDTPKPSQTPSQKARDDQPPPINVPPPSVLLSAFPILFSTGNSLFKPVAGQSAPIKQRILSDPKAVDFLHGYILIATTAARIIAGRKHRWHRDKILAKSMSISAAGSKGMKLAGVDKTQSVREDREAADVAAAWREHVGRLRSAVAAANSSGKTSLKVPEIGENMSVSTAKFVPTAPKPCVICGLKREERVVKVDFEVEDSFGEWWVDHWGHRACKNFWLEHEETLRQR